MNTEGRVIYVGTFSKALSPQLRLGYVVLPPALVPAFRQAKRLTNRHAPLLTQRVLAALIDSGAYERRVRRIRRQHERRRAALLAAMAEYLPAGSRVEGTSAGLHIVLWLPELRVQDEPALVAAARALGVGVHPVSGLYAGGAARPPSAGLVIGYASLEVAAIAQGMAALGRAQAQVLAARRISPPRAVPASPPSGRRAGRRRPG